QIDVLPYPEYKTTGVDADRSALPEVGATPDLVFPQVQRDELRNGIGVVLAERHSVPIVNVAMQFDAGYAADQGGTLGTANFTLAMMDEGTRKRSALEISAAAESLGASITTGSNLDMSTVSLSAIRQELEPSLELYADIVRNPAFSEDEMERLRQRLLAQISQEQNQPVGIALRSLPPILYGSDHAYGIPFTGSGTHASVTSLTRDDLVEFHRTWLRPDNATIFVVGNVTMSEIKPMLERHFGGWDIPRTPLPAKNIAAVDRPDTPSVFLVDKPGAPQSLILAGHVAPPQGVDNNIAIQTMNDVLGGQFTARVNMNLREDKGWAYGAYTFLFSARGQRPFMVYAPVQTDRTVDSIDELALEIHSFLDSRPPTANELERNVKNSVRSLPGQYETGGAVLGTLLANQRFGRPDDYALRLKDEYESLDTGDLEAAAGETIHPRSLAWMIIGDLSKIEQAIRDMNLGEVRVIEAN
ncbi:MAG: insulinase family protein, partial [Proteobacteria bacterium]|nr:insulinase family protein [Pseudomonadota bacterium]